MEGKEVNYQCQAAVLADGEAEESSVMVKN